MAGITDKSYPNYEQARAYQDARRDFEQVHRAVSKGKATLRELDASIARIQRCADAFIEALSAPSTEDVVVSGAVTHIEGQVSDAIKKAQELRQQRAGSVIASGSQEVPAKETPIFASGHRRRSVSRDDFDMPQLHDTLFNFIPASCLETGVALSILQDPGAAGQAVDAAANNLAIAVAKIFHTPLGERPVMHKGSPTTLREMFRNVLQEMHPTKSDQIGRCADPSLAAVWDEQNVQWLLSELMKSSGDCDYKVSSMLSKIKALSGFGEILYGLGQDPQNGKVLGSLLDLRSEEAIARVQQIRTQVRHDGFNSPEARARFERMPIIDGKPLSEYSPNGVERLFGPDHGLGFGNVIVPKGKTTDASSFHPDDGQLKEIYTDALKKHGGPGGLPRHGSVIGNKARPGILTDYAHKNIPQPFIEAGLPELIRHQDLQFEHGIGMNRWQIMGTYPRESWENNLPAAGAHSGTTVEFFTAMNCLSPDSIFSDADGAVPAGVMVSSFMVYGGCHTFVETFPIAEAVASDGHFHVGVDASQKDPENGLYPRFLKHARRVVGDHARKEIGKFRRAYQESVRGVVRSSPK